MLGGTKQEAFGAADEQGDGAKVAERFVERGVEQ